LSDGDPTPARSVEVSVLVAGEHLASIDDVAAALEDAGLRVGAVMATIGVITGVADDPGQLAALQALDGVASVEVGREVRLPPPDSPIQ
jgi:uncharacterized membrane protein (DUF441 family)